MSVGMCMCVCVCAKSVWDVGECARVCVNKYE